MIYFNPQKPDPLPEGDAATVCVQCGWHGGLHHSSCPSLQPYIDMPCGVRVYEGEPMLCRYTPCEHRDCPAHPCRSSLTIGEKIGIFLFATFVFVSSGWLFIAAVDLASRAVPYVIPWS